MSARQASALAIVAGAALLLAAPASSGAARLQTALFRATLSASQSTSWTLNYSNSCGSQTGSGSQKVAFHQAGRVTLVFYRQVGGSHLLWVRVAAPTPTDIPIKGEMTQNGKVNYYTAPQCRSASGGQVADENYVPPKPDCGTKSFRGTMRPTWSTPESYPELPDEAPPLIPVLWLDEPLSATSFRVCPFYGPLIIFRLTKAGLAENRVFGARPKLKLHAEAKKVNQYPHAPQGVRSVTKVEWTMQLRRLG